MLTQKDIDKSLKKLKAIGLDETMIDEDAAAILNSATKTVDAILKRRAELDMQGRENEPLVVLAGERHTNAPLQLHHLFVIKALKKEEDKTSLCAELPHDSAKKGLKNKKKTAHDHPSYNEAANALYDQAYSQYMFSPFARHILIKSCLQEAIPVRYTDASMTPDRNSLDLDDPSTRQSAEACSIPPYKLIDPTSPYGMKIRNHHIVKANKAYAAQTRARIILQKCGTDHIAGEKKHSYDASLLTQFKQAGTSVMAYYLTDQDEYFKQLEKSPQNDRFAPDTTDIIKLPDEPPLPNRPALHVSLFANRFFSADIPNYTQLDTTGKEAAYINVMLSKMGMAEYGLPKGRYLKDRHTGKKDIKKQLKNKRPPQPGNI